MRLPKHPLFHCGEHNAEDNTLLWNVRYVELTELLNQTRFTPLKTQVQDDS